MNFSRFFIDRPIFAAVLSIIIFVAGALALGHEDLLGLAHVPVLAEDPGRLLVRAGVEIGLAAQPGHSLPLVPDLPHPPALGPPEALVAQPGDGELRRPGRRVVGQEGGGHVGEVDARPDLRPAQVDPAVGGALMAGRGVPGSNGLTGREQEVLAMLADGLTTAQVADRLYLSQETVRTHLRSAMRKVEAGTRVQAVAVAIRERLIG